MVRRRSGAVVAALALATPAASEVCTPVEQWRWDGATRDPDCPGACVTPLVVRIADTNGDGRIDPADVPAVVFHHSCSFGARLSALEGIGGGELFTLLDPLLRPSELAAGDLDGDGVAEIVALSSDMSEVVAFEHDGRVRWRSDPLPPPRPFTLRTDPLGIADLDQDGTPEIFLGGNILGADGSIRKDDGGIVGSYRITSALELDPASPGLELLSGGIVLAADGNELWRGGGLDHRPAAADFDGDGDAEVVLVLDDVALFDHQGNLLGSRYAPGIGELSPPATADIDGDGAPEVVVGGRSEVQALDWTGSGFQLLWRQTIRDPTGIAGASAYDFDGDGAAEVLYRDHDRWYLLDGRDGGVLSDFPHPSLTGLEVPVIADIDNDCLAEIVVAGCDTVPERNAVVAYECSPSRAPRSIWNQRTYHVANVGELGAIPRVESPAWSLGGGWITQVSIDSLGAPLADAGPDLRACAGATLSLDGSGSSPCAVPGLLHRWLAGATVACGWSMIATCDVTPAADTTYTLEVACLSAPGCASTTAQDSLLVEVMPDVIPPDLGNSLRAVRQTGSVALSWSTHPLALSYALHRSERKESWPAAALVLGLLVPAHVLADLPAPPPLYFYRAAGASCSGAEGP